MKLSNFIQSCRFSKILLLALFLILSGIFQSHALFQTAAFGRNPAEVWNLEELKKAPAAQWSEPVEKEGEILTQKIWYAGEELNGKPTRVFAFFARPKGDGPFPGIVLVHGGGGTASSDWTELWARRGYAAVAMDLAGHEVLDDGSRKRMEDGGPGQSDQEKFQAFKPEEYRKMWSYHAIASVMRAHSLLISLPCVDAERTAATGISWGGYLTSMLAGIDDRFKVVVPIYGCGDLLRHSIWMNRIEQIPWPGPVTWPQFFDPNQYAGNAKCRVFFVTGTDDFAYPLDSHLRTFECVRNADVRLEVHMPHGHREGSYLPEAEAYINSVLKGTPALPCLGKLTWERKEDGTIFVSAPIKTNPKAAVSAKLRYSNGVGGFVSDKWQVREWNELSAEVDGAEAKVSAVVPKELAEKSPLRLFLEVQTAEGLTVSSHYALCKPVPKAEFKPLPEGGVLLFGHDAEGNLVNRFLAASGAPANWTVENGELLVKSENYANHVHSDYDFRDAWIHVEFKLPKNRDGNSGLYIHGLYEMQILNLTSAKDTNILESGAFYRFAAPQTIAGLPAEEWQSYDIKYIAPRRDETGKIVVKGKMTAWLNGILVQDEVEFEEARSQWHPMRRQLTDCIKQKWEHQKKTGYAPLFLQDHGNPVRFRNVWVKPIEEK